MTYYLSFNRFAYLSNDEYGPDNHEKIVTICLKVNVNSTKTNIPFDDPIIVEVMLLFLSCKEIGRLFSQENMASNTFCWSMHA